MTDTAQVLLLSGSPRPGGVSEQVLELVASGVEQAGGSVERRYLSRLEIAPCTACGGCYSTGMCVINDDMTGFLEAADRADALVIASPVYFSGAPAQLKAVYDRLESRWARRYLLGEERPDPRPATLFVIGNGGDPYGYEPAVTTTKSALAMLGFRPVQVVDVVGFLQSGSTSESDGRHAEAARAMGRLLGAGATR